MNFENFVSDIKNNNWNVYGVEVYEKGKLIHSYGDTEKGIYDIYSATKSILSIAVGIVYDRGLIDLDASILQYLPKDKVNKLNDTQRESYEKLSVKRFLTMSVDGLPFRPEGDNYLDYSLGIEIKNPEEKVFNYNNISAYLVGVALDNILGEDLGAFIETNIFEPLGITKYEYGRSPEGIFYGASKTKLSVNGLSRIGLLMMNKGVYNGKRIISEEYVKMATAVQQMNREGGYGFYFWKYFDGFSINGKWKQKCYCLPDREIMITYLAHIEDNSKDLLNSMEKNILGFCNENQIIDSAKSYIETIFAGDYSGHDTQHSLRVYNNALLIADTEIQCNRFVVSLAALLHDVDDYKLFSTVNNYNARVFLTEQNIDPKTIEEICEIINGVSFSKNRGNSPKSIEGKIVQDADRLDAIGAIGIARTFAYGGAHGRSIMDSLKHFDEKLFLLKDEMNTEEGKRIAKKRHAYLEAFVDEIRSEI